MATLENDFHKFKATVHSGGFNGLLSILVCATMKSVTTKTFPLQGRMHGIHVQYAHPAKLP